MHKNILITLVVLSTSLHSLSLYTRTVLFSCGSEYIEIEGGDYESPIIVNLPTLYINDFSNYYSLRLRTGELAFYSDRTNMAVIQPRFILSFLGSEMFYLGPYMDAELSSFDPISFDSTVGLCFNLSMPYTGLGILDHFYMDLVDIEVGFSLINSDMKIRAFTDLLLLAELIWIYY